MTSNPAAKMGLRRRLYAFSEQGAKMLDRILDGIFSYPVRASANELKNRSSAWPHSSPTHKVPARFSRKPLCEMVAVSPPAVLVALTQPRSPTRAADWPHVVFVLSDGLGPGGPYSQYPRGG